MTHDAVKLAGILNMGGTVCIIAARIRLAKICIMQQQLVATPPPSVRQSFPEGLFALFPTRAIALVGPVTITRIS